MSERRSNRGLIGENIVGGGGFEMKLAVESFDLFVQWLKTEIIDECLIIHCDGYFFY